MENTLSNGRTLKRTAHRAAVVISVIACVDFALWLWVKTEDYWTVWMRIRENIYNALYANHIEIPFPQVRVHTK